MIREHFGSRRGLARLLLEEMRWITGAERASRVVLHDVLRLVFVCRGNICRSAFAALVSRSLNFSALSFGLDTHSGKPADAGMREAARSLGHDLSEHRTSQMDEYQPQDGDLIAVFELGQLQQVRTLLPDVMSAPLGRWARPARTYIHDPYMSLPEFYRKNAQTIEAATRRLIAEIRRAKGDAQDVHTAAARRE